MEKVEIRLQLITISYSKAELTDPSTIAALPKIALHLSSLLLNIDIS
jgi:hypothetical protein